jgi:hypothetical protein
LPRYFHNLNYLDELMIDQEGAEYENLKAAEAEAELTVRDLGALALIEGRSFRLASVRICDGSGTTLAEIFTEDVLIQVFQPSDALIWKAV